MVKCWVLSSAIARMRAPTASSVPMAAHTFIASSVASTRSPASMASSIGANSVASSSSSHGKPGRPEATGTSAHARSECSITVCKATAPPIEQPTKAAMSMPRSSSTAIVSSTLE